MLGTEDQEETRALNTALEEALSTSEPDQIDASIIEFVTSVREGRRPMCEVHDNILSFAMVEAAVASVDCGERVEIDALLEEARADAIAAEADPEARDILQGWSSVREAVEAW